MKNTQLKDRINRILHALNEGLYERQEVVQLTLLSALAGESLFLLGPPGVAKSLLARRLKNLFKNGTAFEYLMNRFSTPDEIFGPISIGKLKNEDTYERITEYYLPTADVVFLDEIWKAGPSIQNTLLTVLNEKLYRNGNKLEQLPLKGLIAASNELPAEGEGLEALWDRFLIRYLVEGIQDDKHFLEYVGTAVTPFEGPKVEDQISEEEFAQWQESINQVTLPNEVLHLILVVRKTLAREASKKPDKAPSYISDRRWKKVVGLLRACAFYNDRTQVDLMDCFLMAHCLWDKPEQIETIKDIVAKTIKSYGYSIKYDFSLFEESIKDLAKEVKQEVNVPILVPQLVNTEHKFQGDQNPYLKITDDKDNQLKGYIYIKKKEFEQITKRAFRGITLYNEDGQSQPDSTIKGKRNAHVNSLEIAAEGYGYRSINFHNSQFDLDATTKNLRQFKTRRPHQAILNNWNEMIAILLNEISKTIGEIKQYQRQTLGHLKTNPFVNPDLAKYPEHNLNELIKQLHGYELQITEIQQGYEKLT